MELMPVKVFTIMANASQSLTATMSLLVFLLDLLLLAIMWIGYKQMRKQRHLSTIQNQGL